MSMGLGRVLITGGPMDKIEIDLWHAYLMEDGEILVCEYVTREKIIWSSSLSDILVQTNYCKFLEAFELGYVGGANAVDVYLFASGSALVNRRNIHVQGLRKSRLATYRQSPA